MTVSQQNDTLGIRLRAERTRLGVSQSVLATHCAISKTTQIAYENGTRSPDVDYVQALSEAGADIIYVLTGKSSEEYVASNIRWDLMLALSEAIDEWAKTRKVETSPAVKSQLLEIFYTQFCADGKADSNAMTRMFLLAEAS